MSSSLPTLYYVPIEPFPGRYTEQWYHNFKATFNAFSAENTTLPPSLALFSRVRVIEPASLVQEIRHGTFLDMSSTLYCKAQQQAQFAELLSKSEINDGDIFFFGDLEFWGIEGWRLALDVCGLKNCKIAGFLHAASFTYGDAFEVAARYQRFTEVGWFEAVDRVYTGSEYAKEAFISRRLDPVIDKISDLGKIQAVSNPMWRHDYPGAALDFSPESGYMSIFEPNPNLPRKRQVIFPNRFDTEKCAMESLELARCITRMDPSVTCLFTTSHPTMRSNSPEALQELSKAVLSGEVVLKTNCTKGQYHEALSQSQVMVTLSTEENFGYCVAESLMYGVIPMMTPGLSHAEFFNKDTPFFFQDWRRNKKMTPAMKTRYAKQVIRMLDVAQAHHQVPITAAFSEFKLLDSAGHARYADKVCMSLCAPGKIARDLASLR